MPTAKLLLPAHALSRISLNTKAYFDFRHAFCASQASREAALHHLELLQSDFEEAHPLPLLPWLLKRQFSTAPAMRWASVYRKDELKPGPRDFRAPDFVEGRLKRGHLRMESLTSNVAYEKLLAEIKLRINSAQTRAAFSINRELVLLYWQIGRQIAERQEQEGWGAKVIDRLAADLGREFPGVEGFGARNLRNMRDLAREWPDAAIVQQLVAKLPWGHNIQILRVAAGPEREWYVNAAIEYGWSRAVLIHQIETRLFERQGKAETNFTRTVPQDQSDMAQQLLKDPYHFDFLTLGPSSRERELEQGLLDHLKDLLLELGKGFAFLGSQYKIEVDERPYYIDLLFYHAHLHCYVVIDLKVREFEPEYAGKMNFYLSAVDELLRRPADGPSIGLILCKGKGKAIVEYALRDTNKPIGVSSYLHTLELPHPLQGEMPSIEDLADAIDQLKEDQDREPTTRV